MPQWRQKAKLVMVPLLLDPNTGTVGCSTQCMPSYVMPDMLLALLQQLFESRDIVNYLRKTYQVSMPRGAVLLLRVVCCLRLPGGVMLTLTFAILVPF